MVKRLLFYACLRAYAGCIADDMQNLPDIPKISPREPPIYPQDKCWIGCDGIGWDWISELLDY